MRGAAFHVSSRVLSSPSHHDQPPPLCHGTQKSRAFSDMIQTSHQGLSHTTVVLTTLLSPARISGSDVVIITPPLPPYWRFESCPGHSVSL